MINQIDLDGMNKIEVAIGRIKHFEPKEGYYLAFSGGKDSIVCKELLNMSGVRYESYYRVTTVDPPELVRYIKKHHPDVIFELSKTNMWELIVKNHMPPTRIARYCCRELKEAGGIGRFIVTGVRWSESVRRKTTRNVVEKFATSKSKEELENKQIFLMSDNEEKRRMIETCPTKGSYILNPIVDWSDDDVWEFIRLRGLPYCELYDQGFNRLGCIGCPMGSQKQRAIQFERWPQYQKAYMCSFGKMLEASKENGIATMWETSKDVMDWFMNGGEKNNAPNDEELLRRWFDEKEYDQIQQPKDSK